MTTNPPTFANDVYRVPEQPLQGESLGVPQNEEDGSDGRFTEIARDYVNEQFDEIAQNEESREFESTPDISQILRVGASMRELREKYSTRTVAPHILIERESKAGAVIFSPDPQVAQRRFFYLPTDTHDEWFHRQTSAVREKSFTNSYSIHPDGVRKSATYFDVIENREKNVSVTPSDEEVQDLIIAANKYEQYAREFVYSETPTPLRGLMRIFKPDRAT